MSNLRQIVVPVDFYQHTEGLVAFAIDIASRLKGNIIFLNVAGRVTEGGEYFDVYPASFTIVNEELLAQAQTRMNDLVERTRSICPNCTGVVLNGDVAETIVSYVKDAHCDMIIIGTHGYKGIQKIFLGSVAERVVQRASCPILVFNPYKGERG